MLLHLPIVIAAMLSPVAVSDTVPQFDIARECRFEGESIVEFGNCSEDERAAFLEIKNEWAQFAGADKKTCIVMSTIGGFASYVELLTCLEMARDLESLNTNRNDPDAKARAPGVTVGVGHDPVTPEQAPGKGTR
jgi:hypothetical protein